MDSAKLIFTEPVSLIAALQDARKIDTASQEMKKQACRDFEGVLIHKLLDQMKNTIGDWGLEKDELSKQVHGIFYLYLARDIASNGGFGMWKDVYQFLNSSEKESATGFPKRTISRLGAPVVESIG